MENEPRINLRPMMLWTVGIFTLMALMSVYAWFALPADAQIITHWNLEGQPDGWSPKTMGLLGLPATVIIMAGLLFIFFRFTPRRLNIARSTRGITAIWAASLLLFLALHALTVATALGVKADASLLAPIGMGVLFIVIGNYMGKLRSNFFAGAKTPWTLSSDLSWEKTNRLAGKLFVTMGITLILGCLTGDPLLWFYLFITQGLAMGVITIVYSYFVWKLDPHKYAENGDDDTQAQRPNVAVPRERMVTWGSIALLLLIALGFVLTGNASKPTLALEPAARELVSNMAAGDYRAAESRFNLIMRIALPPDKMKAVWEKSLATYGKFVRQTGTREAQQQGYNIIYVTCQFENATMDIKVVFSKSREVTGLWILPSTK